MTAGENHSANNGKKPLFSAFDEVKKQKITVIFRFLPRKKRQITENNGK